MSGEFGSYVDGYFHSQIEMAADDCLAGHDDLTKLWGEFFRTFHPLARAISWSEAGDSGPDYPILECIKTMPELKEKLAAIDAYLKPFQRVAEEAVAEAIRRRGA